MANKPVVGGSAKTHAHSTDLLNLGKVAAAHGLEGKLHIRLYNRDSECLVPGLKLELRSSKFSVDSSRTLTVETAVLIPHKNLFLVAVAEINHRTAAEALRGASVWVSRSDLVPLETDEFYLADTIGLAVEQRRDQGQNQFLGHVVAITSNGAQDLLEVAWQAPGGKRYVWLLPVLPQFISEIDQTKIYVQLPQGLLPEPLDQEAGIA